MYNLWFLDVLFPILKQSVFGLSTVVFIQGIHLQLLAALFVPFGQCREVREP